MTLNVNSFEQAPVRGQADLQIAKSGVLSGQVSPNQATALKNGDLVKIDTTITTKGIVPQFVAAANSDINTMRIVRGVKQGTYSAGDAIEVAFIGGVVQWLEAGDTITPGATVQESNDGTQVIPKASGKSVGYSIDYGVSGELVRIVHTGLIAFQS